MAKKEISVFSLSLLDLLFCAFGGVIVLTVVFSAIIKYEEAQKTKSKDLAIALDVKFTNGNNIPGNWTVQARNGQTLNSALNSRNITKEVLSILEPNWVYYPTIKNAPNIPREKGHYRLGLSGKLKELTVSKKASDTIFLMMHPEYAGVDQFFDWTIPPGDIIIKGQLFTPDSLPRPFEFSPIPANALSNKRSIPLLLTHEKNTFHISILNL